MKGDYRQYIQRNFQNPELFEFLGDFPIDESFTSIYRDIKKGNTLSIVFEDTGKLPEIYPHSDDNSKAYLSLKSFVPAAKPKAI